MSKLFDSDSRQLVVGVVIGAAMAEALYYTLEWFSRRRKPYFKAIFFPDKKVACRNHFTTRHGCVDQRCRFGHDETSSYAQLLRTLTSAQRSLDLCVLAITCDDLGNAIVDMHKKGVVVRVITDQDNQDSSGCQVPKFRSEGIQVRLGGGSFLMHHKFAILDGKHLINGSFNWTRSAIMYNNENLLLTNHEPLVRPYRDEFERLWTLYNPKESPSR